MDYDRLIQQAYVEAKRYHHKYIRTEHLFLALVNLGWLEEFDIDMACLLQAVALMRCPTCSAEEKMELSASAKRAHELALQYAGNAPLNTQHTLLGILRSSVTVSRLLANCGIDSGEWMELLESKQLDG